MAAEEGATGQAQATELVQTLVAALQQVGSGGAGGGGPSISLPTFSGHYDEIARYWLAKVELVLLAKGVSEQRKTYTLQRLLCWAPQRGGSMATQGNCCTER